MNHQFYPSELHPQQLDHFLAQGWYRMGQKVFTVDYIFVEKWIRVFWLRFRLKEFVTERKHRQLMARFNRFQVTTRPLVMTEELEFLYSEYYQSLDFATSSSASLFLFDQVFQGNEMRNVFDSRLIEVRDQGKLIAAGIYDLGENSLAGILNFFHPDYRKFSPGKFLILKKMELAQEAGLDWYYPGYIGHGLPKFDYKLYPGIASAEIFDPFSGEWIPWREGLVEELAKTQEELFNFSPDLDSDNLDS
jgi:arginyl-tRNA--protein-N-Asp/Glu arginylyltransferase